MRQSVRAAPRRLLPLLALALGCCGLLPPAAPDVPVPRAGIQPECRPLPGIAGAEDIVADPATGLLYVSSTDRRALLQTRPPLTTDGRPGHLYRLDLLQDPPRAWDVTPEALRNGDFAPHGMSLLPHGDGAILFVIDHGAGRDPRTGRWRDVKPADRPTTVERLLIAPGATSDQRLLRRAPPISDDLLIGANDIAAIGENRFYVTNDHGPASNFGNSLRDVAGLNGGFLAYYDGTAMRRVGPPLPWANGIHADIGAQRIYVTSSSRGTVSTMSWADDAPETLTVLDPPLATGTALDNIAPDEADGSLLIAAHPQPLRFAAFGLGLGEVRTSPSQVLRVPRGADGLPLPPREILRQTGDESRPGEIAAASVAVPHRRRGRDRLVVGSVFSGHILVCDLPP